MVLDWHQIDTGNLPDWVAAIAAIASLVVVWGLAERDRAARTAADVQARGERIRNYRMVTALAKGIVEGPLMTGAALTRHQEAKENTSLTRPITDLFANTCLEARQAIANMKPAVAAYPDVLAVLTRVETVVARIRVDLYAVPWDECEALALLTVFELRNIAQELDQMSVDATNAL